MRFFKTLLLAMTMLVSLSSQAAVESYGTLLSGSYQPGTDFASLSVSGSGNVYSFTLSAYDLNALFANQAFIGSIAVKVSPDVKANTIAVSSISGGVTKLTASNGGGPGGDWDFRFVLGQGANDRLLANESVTWTATFASNVSIDDYALHVQGLSSAQGSSAWYLNSVVTTPVPEPAAWTLLLVGLAVVTGMRKRRAS
jgi:hypothetical protein